MKAFQGPKGKIVRRFGVNIFEADKYDRILGRRKFPPGMHGNTRRSGKISEYGKQLVEKQKMKFMYGMTERQFRNFYKKAERKKGATGINLLQPARLKKQASHLFPDDDPSLFQKILFWN